MAEFFKVAGVLNWLEETDMCHGLWERLMKDHGLKGEREVWKLKISIEALMCELFDEATAAGDWNLYMQLEYFIKSILARTTDGPAWAPMDQFVAALEPGSGLITFNYDCLLEKSLVKSDWRPETGYRTLFQGRFVERGEKDVLTQRVGGGMGSWDYLKLHGSLNWLVDRDIHTNWALHTGRLTTRMSLYAYLLDAIRTESSTHPLTNMSGILENEEDSDMFSLIIPPSRKKEYGEYRAILGYLWDIAKKKISASDELVFIGFSFPRTDENIKVLFESFQGGVVTVVNRTIDEDLRARYQSVFPKAKCDFRQESFQDYCSRLQPVMPPVQKTTIPASDCPEITPENLAASVLVSPTNNNSEVIVQGSLAAGQIEAKILFNHGEYTRKRFAQYDDLGIPSFKLVAIAEQAASVTRSLPCGKYEARTASRQEFGKTFEDQFDLSIEIKWTGNEDVVIHLADFVPKAIRSLCKKLDTEITQEERKRIAGAPKALGINQLI